jgi:hypothetical protein
MRTLEIKAVVCDDAWDAIRYAAGFGGLAVLTDAGYLVARESECERLAAAGAEFAYLYHHKPTNRVMTVPVN